MRYDRLLEGKRCAVTSGAHGMGYSIARLFVRHGAQVAICGRDPSGEKAGETLREITPGSFFYRCDLSDKTGTEGFAEEILRRWGGADVLVCNAGVNRKELVIDITDENRNYVNDVNLLSALTMTQKLLPGMMERGSGSIIYISSMNALAPSPRTGSYVMSKGAVQALMKVTAVEAGPSGVRVNAICPGWVATTYLRADIEAAGGGIEGAEKALEFLDGSAPLISPARAEDIANHALFLASDLSAFVSGVILKSDGGATIQERAYAYPEPSNGREMRLEHYETILEEMASVP